MGMSYHWIGDPSAKIFIHLGQVLVVGCTEELILIGLCVEPDDKLADVNTSIDNISNKGGLSKTIF